MAAVEEVSRMLGSEVQGGLGMERLIYAQH